MAGNNKKKDLFAGLSDNEKRFILDAFEKFQTILPTSKEKAIAEDDKDLTAKLESRKSIYDKLHDVFKATPREEQGLHVNRINSYFNSDLPALAVIPQKQEILEIRDNLCKQTENGRFSFKQEYYNTVVALGKIFDEPKLFNTLKKSLPKENPSLSIKVPFSDKSFDTYSQTTLSDFQTARSAESSIRGEDFHTPRSSFSSPSPLENKDILKSLSTTELQFISNTYKTIQAIRPAASQSNDIISREIIKTREKLYSDLVTTLKPQRSEIQGMHIERLHSFFNDTLPEYEQIPQKEEILTLKNQLIGKDNYKIAALLGQSLEDPELISQIDKLLTPLDARIGRENRQNDQQPSPAATAASIDPVLEPKNNSQDLKPNPYVEYLERQLKDASLSQMTPLFNLIDKVRDLQTTAKATIQLMGPLKKEQLQLIASNFDELSKVAHREDQEILGQALTPANLSIANHIESMGAYLKHKIEITPNSELKTKLIELQQIVDEKIVKDFTPEYYSTMVKLGECLTSPDKINAINRELEDAKPQIKKHNSTVNDARVTPTEPKAEATPVTQDRQPQQVKTESQPVKQVKAVTANSQTKLVKHLNNVQLQSVSNYLAALNTLPKNDTLDIGEDFKPKVNEKLNEHLKRISNKGVSHLNTSIAKMPEGEAKTTLTNLQKDINDKIKANYDPEFYASLAIIGESIITPSTSAAITRELRQRLGQPAQPQTLSLEEQAAAILKDFTPEPQAVQQPRQAATEIHHAIVQSDVVQTPAPQPSKQPTSVQAAIQTTSQDDLATSINAISAVPPVAPVKPVPAPQNKPEPKVVVPPKIPAAKAKTKSTVIPTSVKNQIQPLTKLEPKHRELISKSFTLLKDMDDGNFRTPLKELLSPKQYELLDQHQARISSKLSLLDNAIHQAQGNEAKQTLTELKEFIDQKIVRNFDLKDYSTIAHLGNIINDQGAYNKVKNILPKPQSQEASSQDAQALSKLLERSFEVIKQMPSQNREQLIDAFTPRGRKETENDHINRIRSSLSNNTRKLQGEQYNTLKALRDNIKQEFTEQNGNKDYYQTLLKFGEQIKTSENDRQAAAEVTAKVKASAEVDAKEAIRVIGRQAATEAAVKGASLVAKRDAQEATRVMGRQAVTEATEEGASLAANRHAQEATRAMERQAVTEATEEGASLVAKRDAQEATRAMGRQAVTEATEEGASLVAKRAAEEATRAMGRQVALDAAAKAIARPQNKVTSATPEANVQTQDQAKISASSTPTPSPDTSDGVEGRAPEINVISTAASTPAPAHIDQEPLLKPSLVILEGHRVEDISTPKNGDSSPLTINSTESLANPEVHAITPKAFRLKDFRDDLKKTLHTVVYEMRFNESLGNKDKAEEAKKTLTIKLRELSISEPEKAIEQLIKEQTDNLSRSLGHKQEGRLYEGIGAEVEYIPGQGIKLLEIYKNSPAEKLGLKPGDIITKAYDANDQKISLTDTAMPAEEAFASVRGKLGQKLKFELAGGTIVSSDQTRSLMDSKFKTAYQLGYKETFKETLAKINEQEIGQARENLAKLKDIYLDNGSKQGLQEEVKRIRHEIKKAILDGDDKELVNKAKAAISRNSSIAKSKQNNNGRT